MLFRKVINRLIKVILFLLVVVGVGIAIYAVFYILGMRINDTRSVAKGVYWSVDEPIGRGRYVTFCPPDTAVFRMARHRGYISIGFCPSNYAGLMKFVAGVPGDTYRFTEDGLYINEALIANTKPIHEDGSGDKLPVLSETGKLGQGEYILMGNAVANSFDARYYGIINQDRIQSVVIPLWIEE